MDFLAHAAYGATAFSRSGLAGGRAGASRPWVADGTVWCALLFGVLPDLVSLGPRILTFFLSGTEGNFFARIDRDTLASYRVMHSLVVSLAAAGLIRLVCSPLFLPSLAWPLHVAMDALTHGEGTFQTTVFYPLSSWGLDSIRWWEHPALIAGYWLIPVATWCGLALWRGRARAAAPVRARTTSA